MRDIDHWPVFRDKQVAQLIMDQLAMKTRGKSYSLSTELEAHFIRLLPHGFEYVDNLLEAHGVMFLCPLCYMNNGGHVGTHSVICWFKNRGVPDQRSPTPGRWNPAGTTLDDLYFVPPGNISVWLTSKHGCGWHGFVVDGHATTK